MKKYVLVWLFLGLFLLTGCSGMGMMQPDGYYQGNANGNNMDGETYEEIIENDFIRTEDMPVYTFNRC